MNLNETEDMIQEDAMVPLLKLRMQKIEERINQAKYKSGELQRRTNSSRPGHSKEEDQKESSQTECQQESPEWSNLESWIRAQKECMKTGDLYREAKRLLARPVRDDCECVKINSDRTDSDYRKGSQRSEDSEGAADRGLLRRLWGLAL